jgi:hypothetical protein
MMYIRQDGRKAEVASRERKRVAKGDLIPSEL